MPNAKLLLIFIPFLFLNLPEWIFYPFGFYSGIENNMLSKGSEARYRLSAKQTFGPVANNLPNSIPFSFTLVRSAATSAGVYTTEGILIKTLWSGIKYEAGNHSLSWDKTDDQGRLAPDGSYVIRVLSNNVTYTWEGIIGNNSDSLTGAKVVRAFKGMAGMAITGNTAYIATKYNEGAPAQLKISLTNPQIRQPLFFDHTGVGQETNFVATDDNYVYWAGFDPMNITRSFIWASKVSDDSEVKFANGLAQPTEWGRTYPSAINKVVAPGSEPTGLAVQKTGPYLFVSRKGLNKLYVLHKTTGALVQTIAITNVGLLTIDNTDRLWVQTGTKILKYKVNSNGTLTGTGVRITGLTDPQGLAASRNGSIVLVADGGASQQLKAFSNTTGTPAWTYGQTGGYATNANVTNSKFYFSDPLGNVAGSFIAFESDNSFWIGDTGNNRAQHYTTNRSYIERIMYLPGFYSCAVDKNNPTRVFANHLEFSVDYTKPLAGNNGSWKLIRNWSYARVSDYANIDNNHLAKLQFVSTLKNNRTYGLLPALRNNYQVVELVTGGSLRFTGVEIDYSYQLYPDGSLRKVSGQSRNGSILTWSKKPLTGFDASHNPLWGNEITVATSPPTTPEDPVLWGHVYRTGETTSSNIVIAFDGWLGGQGYHLGGIKAGSNKWLWKASLGTRPDFQGMFPEDGAYDNGNGVKNAGSVALALDRNIIWGYHGEFWKQGQTNKWNHYYDNGLFIGQFGTTRAEHIGEMAVKGMAGNSFSPVLVKHTDGKVYLYHNDESDHAGLHRWKIDGLNTIREQTIPVTLTSAERGLLGQYFEGADLNNFNVKTIRTDPLINFQWSKTTPPNTNLTGPDNFSVIWTGFVAPLYSEKYTFYSTADDGVRLWVDGKLLINKWQNQSATEHSATVTLMAGRRYAIRLEYYDHQGSASVALLWSSASQKKEIIPSTQLVPAKVPDRSAGIDLLEGLPYNSILDNNLYGWQRNPLAENYTNQWAKWWSVRTSVMSYRTQSPDLSASFCQIDGACTVSRNLGSPTGLLSFWKLAGKINYDGNYPNVVASSGAEEFGGNYLEVLDDKGRIITRFFQRINPDNNWVTSVHANDKIITQDSESRIRSVTNKPQPIAITATNGELTFKYGPYAAVTTKVFDPASNWRMPKTMRLYFFGKGHNFPRVIDIESMRFFVDSPPATETTNSRQRVSAPADNSLTGQVTLPNKALAASEIVIYPNPGQSMLRVKHPVISDRGSIELISADGRKLKTLLLVTGSTSTSIDIGFLSQGFYLIQFTNGSSRIRTNFIKQ